MKALTIRQKLHNFLEVADDERVEEVYISLKDEVEKASFKYAEELKTILNERLEEYSKGSTSLVGSKESKQKITHKLSD